ncbi:MAG: GNAT family N-acetyltransferase [Botrimarina sp.]
MEDGLVSTERLRLIVESLDACRARIAAMPDEHRAMLSPAWLALLEQAEPGDPWVLGFTIVRDADGAVVGSCGFKGPPSADGVVEIAYAIEPHEQGQGYATEAAEALTRFALQSAGVRRVLAHTLPAESASTRVLTKCGYRNVGEVIDPDDGSVWRWEYSDPSQA